MELKREKILILSIIIVLISSWFLGNLIGLESEEGPDAALLSGVPEDVFLGSMIILILLTLLYFFFLYFRFEGDKTTVISSLLLLGFWIFTFLGGALFVVYVFWPFVSQLELRFPMIGEFSTIPFLADIGFILILSLITLLFSYLIFLKVVGEKERKENFDLELDDLKENIDEDKDGKDLIEDSLSSTLDRAISDINRGENVRTTIIRCYRETSRFLEEMGKKNERSMTPREFKDIIIEDIPRAEKMISEITFLFEEARYSPHELEERKRKKVLQHLKRLREGLT